MVGSIEKNFNAAQKRERYEHHLRAYRTAYQGKWTDFKARKAEVIQAYLDKKCFKIGLRRLIIWLALKKTAVGLRKKMKALQ